MDALEMKRVLFVAIEDEWDDGRTYLGMSQIGQCPRKLYFDLVQGRRRPTERGVLYCHEGYLHEGDILDRMERMGIVVEERGKELAAGFDSRVRGHVDGVVGEVLIEVKTTDRDGFQNVRERGAKPRHQDQVQMYMFYGGWARAWVIYKERESGELWITEVGRSEEAGRELEEKARAILVAVDAKKPPECECGHCRR